MGVRILVDKDDENAVIYCSTTDTAFGPVIYDRDSAYEKADRFLRWLREDARHFTDGELQSKYADFNYNYEKIKAAQEKEDFPDEEEG